MRLPKLEWGGSECMGPLVVMCHWLGGSAQTWAMVGERLAERGVRCVAVDLPGFGIDPAHDDRTVMNGAPGDGAGYGVREMADAVMEAVRGILAEPTRDDEIVTSGEPDIVAGDPGPERPWLLMGHSMGGKIAAVVAREAVNGAAGLQGLRGVVLVDASPPSPEPMTDSQRRDGVEVLGSSTGDQAKDRKHAESFVKDNVGKPELGEATICTATDGVLRANKAAIRAWFEGGSKEDWSSFVGELPLPALVFAGTEDPMLGPEAQRELVLPHFMPRGTVADLVLLEGAGHLGPLERPGTIAEHVVRFCAELRLPVGRRAQVSARFGALMGSELVSAQTRAVMQARLVDEESACEPRSFDPRGMQVMRELARRVVPGASFDVAARVDTKLAESSGDGWRPAELPGDAAAWRRGLASLDAGARREHGVGFAELNDELQDGLLDKAATGKLGEGAMGRLLHALGKHEEAYSAAEMKLWFEEVRGELAKLYMADPRTMERVGFTGFADEQGFTQIRLGEREGWER